MRREVTEIFHLKQSEKTREEKEEERDFEPGGDSCVFAGGNHSFSDTVK